MEGPSATQMFNYDYIQYVNKSKEHLGLVIEQQES